MASSRSRIAAVFRIFLLTLIKATLRSNNLNDKILFYLRGFEERLWSLRAAVWFISEDYSLIIYIFFCGRIFGWWVLSGWGSEMICVCFPILVSRVFFCVFIRVDVMLLFKGAEGSYQEGHDSSTETQSDWAKRSWCFCLLKSRSGSTMFWWSSVDLPKVAPSIFYFWYQLGYVKILHSRVV